MKIMGIVNVTPDSFSDGGMHATTEAAIAHGRQLRSAGADVLDIGGESTRPGSTRVDPRDEQARILDVVRSLAKDTTVSVDTLHATTARAAVDAGATIINDVSGGLHDPDLLRVVAESGAHVVLGHWRGIPDPHHRRSRYIDVSREVVGALADRIAAARAAGIPASHIMVDPGLGFDKTGAQSWELLQRVQELTALGYPVLIGASRKRMLKDLLDGHPSAPNTPADRDLATSVITGLLAGIPGVWGVRVHDVLGSAVARDVATHMRAGSGERARHPGLAVRTGAATIPEPPAAGAGPADVIHLTGLEVYAHHGVFAHEREAGQRFVIDAVVSTDIAAAAADDDLAHTVNYAELATALTEAARRDPVDLIETLAERLARTALAMPGVDRITITVHKPDAPVSEPFDDVAVTITRGGSA